MIVRSSLISPGFYLEMERMRTRRIIAEERLRQVTSTAAHAASQRDRVIAKQAVDEQGVGE